MKRFIAITILMTLFGLFYVHLEVEAVRIGYRIRKQDETKTLFLDRARALKYNIARLSAPSVLEKKLLAQKIELSAPKSWQTLSTQNRNQAPQSLMGQSVMGEMGFGKFLWVPLELKQKTLKNSLGPQIER